MTTKAERLTERRTLVEEGPIVFLNRCALQPAPTKRIRRAYWLMFGNRPRGLGTEFCKEIVTRALQIEHAEMQGEKVSGRVRQRLQTLQRRLDKPKD